MSAFFKRARLLYIAVAVLALSTLSATPASAASGGHRWAGFEGTANVSGIDGYIRGSGTVAIPSNQFHANWINLCQAACGQWVQLGVYQGHFGTITSSTQMHIYLENNWDGCFYSSTDYGAPSTANYGYYISYDGNHFSSQCGSDFYEFAARKGSVTNAPIGYGFMQAGSGQPMVKTELYSSTGSSVPHNTDYFGTDDNHNPNVSYGIHLLKGGSWLPWTVGNEAYNVINDSPPTLHRSDNPWSFYTN